MSDPVASSPEVAHRWSVAPALVHGWVVMLQEGEMPPAMVVGSLAKLEGALACLADRIVDVELLAASSLGLTRLTTAYVTVGELADGLPDLVGIAGLGGDVVVTVDADLSSAGCCATCGWPAREQDQLRCLTATVVVRRPGRLRAVLCHSCYADPASMPDCVACRGTGRATSMPLCDDPWNEVVPGLFQGGHDVRSQSDAVCVVDDEFDLVVSLVTRAGYGPADGVEHVVLRLADAAIDPATGARVDEVAARVADAVRDGRRVLVRCSGGLNRSGLVVASALVRLGRTPDEAIASVRAARGPWALTNPGFVVHLRGLETRRPTT